MFLPFNIAVETSLPVKLSTLINFKKSSFKSPLESMYRTHKVSCSDVEMSVVSSARTEKHFASLTFATIFFKIISLHMFII